MCVEYPICINRWDIPVVYRRNIVCDTWGTNGLYTTCWDAYASTGGQSDRHGVFEHKTMVG